MAASHPSLSPHHALAASTTANIAGLQSESHDPRDLCTRALNFFDRPVSSYSLDQRQAAGQLEEWFTIRRSRSDVTKTPRAKVEELIALIGKVLFMDGLRGVPFEYYNNAYPPYSSGIELAFSNLSVVDGRVFIALNRRKKYWKHRSRRVSWMRFIGVILHECTHAYFQRYMRRYGGNARDSHNAAWQIITKAIERRFLIEFGWKLDLQRGGGLIGDLVGGKIMDLTEQELKDCFDGKFEYVGEGLETMLKEKFTWRERIDRMMRYRTLSVPSFRIHQRQAKINWR